MNIQQAIARVIDRQDLDRESMAAVMTQIMSGDATPAQIGGFLIGLRIKGETVEEIAAAAEVMASLAEHVPLDLPHLIDIVGTGGDGTHSFNISTASTFVAAAAGAYVAKHGNRSVSSSSGSADVLEAAGVNLALTPGQVGDAVRETHVGFMYAPAHHAAMKHAVGPRREMAVRTIFNLLGPLTNPAGVKRQLVGVFSADLVVAMAEVLGQLGSEHAIVVHSEDGMDEISVSAPSLIAELKHGKVQTMTVSPEDFGIERTDSAELIVADARESLAMIDAVLDGQKGAAQDIVAMNAGAGIYVAGLVDSLESGVQRARQVIADGSARNIRNDFVQFTQGCSR
jgi:anthranilate phosphoribosyltransferase